MTKLSLTETLILSIVAENPVHGYDINKLLEERNVRKWADVGFSSIYYVLERLKSKGFVHASGADGREKKVFSITASGKGAISKKAIELISIRHPAYTHFMTGMTSSLLIDEVTVKKSLSARLDILHTDLLALQAKIILSPPADPQTRMLFDFSVTMLHAEIKWVKSELKRR